MNNRQKQNGENSDIQPGDHYNNVSLSSLMKDKSIKSPMHKSKMNEMEKSFYQDFDRVESMTKIRFFNQNKAGAQSTALLTSQNSSKFNKTQLKFNVKNSIKDSPIKIQPAPGQSNLSKYLLKKDIQQFQSLVAIRDRAPPDQESPKVQPIMFEDNSEPSPGKVYNMTQNIDHEETKKILIKLGQYKGSENYNKELNEELEKTIQDKKLSVQEEFQARVRAYAMKDKEIQNQKDFENKKINKPSSKKRTKDNRVITQIEPGDKDLYPREFNFDKYIHYEDYNNQAELDQHQKDFIFAKNNKFNKKQIFQKMVQLIYLNASQHINRATAENPQVLNANKNHWFQMMLKNPKLQKFYYHFNEQLSVIIKEQIDKNKDNFDMFMLHPRPEKGNICNLYPSKTIVPLDVEQKEKRMINNSIDVAKEKYNYKKQKQKMIEQMRLGKQKPEKKTKVSRSVEKEAVDIKENLNICRSNLISKMDKNKEDQEKEKKNGKLLSDFQMILKEQTTNVDLLILELDEDNEAFNKDLDEYEKAHNQLEVENGQFMSLQPLVSLQNRLLEWDAKNDENIINKNEFNKFATEFALSLSEYEKKLKDEIKGHEMELQHQTRMFSLWKRNLLEKTQMQIEAYEMVLPELKMLHIREYERVCMQNCDLESKILNSQIPQYQIHDLVKECEGGLVLRTTIEARSYITRLCNVVKNQQKTVNLFKEMSENKDQSVSVAQENLIKEKASSKVNLKLREYYQHQLCKIIRDLGVLDDHEQEMENFLKINEFSERVQDQTFYRQIFDEINIDEHLLSFTNKIIGQQQNLEELSQCLDELGVNGEIIEDEGRLFQYIQQLNNQKEKKGSKKGKDNTINKNQVVPKLGLIDIQLNKHQQKDIQEILQHSIDGYLETPVANSQTGQPDPDRIESVTVNIEDNLKELEMYKNKAPKKILKLKKGSSYRRNTRIRSNKNIDPGQQTPGSELSELSIGLELQKNFLSEEETPHLSDQLLKSNNVIKEEIVGEVSPTAITNEKKTFDELQDMMIKAIDKTIVITEDNKQDIETKKEEINENKPPHVQEEAEFSEIKQIIMSSVTSSEDEKKSEISDKKEELLNVKKRKPPMLRLNSKPVLAKVISSNNLNIKNFKSKLDETQKVQFEKLLIEIKDELAQENEKTPITPGSNRYESNVQSSTSKMSDSNKSSNINKIEQQSKKEVSRMSISQERVSNGSKSQNELEKVENDEVSKISMTSSLNGSVSSNTNELSVQVDGEVSNIRPISGSKSQLMSLNPTKIKTTARPIRNDSSLSIKNAKVSDKSPDKSSFKAISSQPKFANRKITIKGDESKVKKDKAGDKSKNPVKKKNKGDQSKVKKDGSTSKNMGLKNTSKKSKIKLDKVGKGKIEGKKGIQIINTLITQYSQDDGTGENKQSITSVSIKSSNDGDSSDEERDRIISLRKINLKQPMPIIGDMSLEMRKQSSKTVSQSLINSGIMSKVSLIQRGTLINEVGELVEEELKPIIEIDDNLNNLYYPKYQKTMKQADKQAKENDGFKLKAKAIQEFQEVVENAMGSLIGYDDSQRMMEDPTIQNFFEIYSELNSQVFQFVKINKFMKARGEIEEEEQSPDNKFQEKKKKIKKGKKNEENRISQGDILKPTFSENGEFIGTQVRTELINAIYVQSMESDEDQKVKEAVLKRVIKNNCFINRIMRDGLRDDFMLIQSNLEVAKKKDFKDEATEIDGDLPKIPDLLDDTNMVVYWALRDHAVDLITRLNDAPVKRNYQNMLWEKRTIADLWNYELPGIYLDYQHLQQDQDRGTSFGSYINALFEQIKHKLDQAQFPKGHKEDLIIERFIKLGMDQDDNKVVKIPRSTGIQAVPQMKQVEIQTQAMPGYTAETLIQEMLPKKDLNLSKTRIRQDGPKNQLILDRELENQFEQTLDLFDVYVNNLSFIDQKKFNDNEFNKVKLEVDMVNNTIIDNTEKGKSKKDPNKKTSMDTQEDMEYDVKKIRYKLNHAIEEINNDPYLFQKFKQTRQKELEDYIAQNPMKVQVRDLSPDLNGWQNDDNTSGKNQKKYNQLNHDSTENTLYDKESKESRTHLPMIKTNSNFSSDQNFKKAMGSPFDLSQEILTHPSMINVTKKTKGTNSLDTNQDLDLPERNKISTLHQSQSYYQTSPRALKPNATVKVKPNLRASMQQMNSTKASNNKSFIFKDPLDDIVTRKKKKYGRNNDTLFKSFQVPNSMTNTEISAVDIQQMRHRNETIAQFINRVDKDQQPIPAQVFDKAINNKGKNFEFYNGDIQRQWNSMTKSNFNQTSIQRIHHSIDREAEQEIVNRENDLYKQTMMQGFGNKIQRLNKFNATQSSLSFLSEYQQQLRMTKQEIFTKPKNQDHFSNPKINQQFNSMHTSTQKFASPLQIHAIQNQYSPQNKIKMLQMRAQAVGVGTQLDNTPNMTPQQFRSIQLKNLTATSSQESVLEMDQIIQQKKSVQIENNYNRQRGLALPNQAFGNTKDSYRPETEENQGILTNRFSKQQHAETDEDINNSKSSQKVTERTAINAPSTTH